MGSRAHIGKFRGGAKAAPARSRAHAKPAEAGTQPLPGIEVLPSASASAELSRPSRKLPIRSSPLTTAPSLRTRLTALGKKRAPKGHAQTPVPETPPFAQKVLLQELEPRLLLSADLNPFAGDALLTTPSSLPAEFRALTDEGKPSVVTTAAVAPVQRSSELVFVDTATPDYETLVEAMRTAAQAEGLNVEFVLIDNEKDGIGKITETLAGKKDLDAIHVISHARDGAVQLGSSELDFGTLVKRATQIKSWGNALTTDGDILFYGCDLAASEEGKSLLDALSRLTGADVAASEDKTGAAAKGGDWQLEFRSGAIEAPILVSMPAQVEWNHTLVISGDDTGSTNEDTVLTVAAPGLLANDLAPTPGITAGYDANYVVANDATANDLWEDLQGGGIDWNWDFGTVPVENTSPLTNYDAGIIQSYAFPSSLGGGATVTGGLTDPQSEASTSFEFWFKADSSATTGSYLIFEAGDTSGGMAIVYNATSDRIELHYVDNTSGGIYQLNAPLGAINPRTEFIQVVAVVDDAGEALRLYINGGSGNGVGVTAVFNESTAGDNISDWSANDGSGLGQADGNAGNGIVVAAASGAANFVGEMAIVRIYQSVLSAAQIEANFATIANHLFVSGASGATSATMSEPAPGAAPNSATITTAQGALVTVFSDGRYTYNPNGAFDSLAAGQSTTDSFTYTARDVFGSTDTATVTITITGQNDAPTALALSNSTVNENVAAGSTVGTFSSTDPDTGNTFTYALVAGAGSTDNAAFSISGNTLTINASPNFEAQPSYSIRVRTTDQGGLTFERQFTITVADLNEAPTLGNGTLASVPENTASPAGQTVATIFAGQFADVDSGSSFGGIAVVGNTASAGTEGVWQYSSNGGTNWFAIGTVADGATALALSTTTLVRFVPVAGYSGSPPALTVRGLDNTYAGAFSTTTGSETRANVNTTTNGGTTAIAAATGTISTTVTPANAAPTANPDAYTVAEDSTLTIGWWDTDWTRRRQITFNNTNVGGFAPAETLSNFPVLLVLNGTNIDYSLTQDDGGDLRFFDADGTPLAYEVERWDESGSSYVWVKVPQIDIGATDSITMYYGNAAIADGEDPSTVWAGTGYRSVYHLDDIGPTVEDATSTNYDGTATNGATGGQAGQIGLAYGFDAADDYINLGDDRSFLDDASAATFSAWVNPDNDGVNRQHHPEHQHQQRRRAQRNLAHGDRARSVRRRQVHRPVRRRHRQPPSSLRARRSPRGHGTTSRASLMSSPTQITVYVDGVARPITPGPYTLPGTAFPNSPSASASIGSSDEGAGPYFDGRIDEARIATVGAHGGMDPGRVPRDVKPGRDRSSLRSGPRRSRRPSAAC